MSKQIVRPTFFSRIREAQKAKLTSFGSRLRERFSYKLPDKYKDTWVDRLVTYWQSLLRDYREAGLDTLKDIRERPLKASVYGTALGTAYLCAKRNPDEISYRQRLIEAQNDVAFTCPSIQNKRTISYLKHLEQFGNQGVVRYFSFGIFSIVWFDNYAKCLGLYEARCDYLKPTYLEICKSRIVDVGFWNKWWLLDKNMVDFDVNEDEWSQPN
ncbi:mitochondrial import inner membrane translocase subunit Tim29 [Neocloeon triangulifer]|uniref:mitochondrial import inner membrane translocase subunit Tim29 n=1 Tax=Neocloeon triangulifer TaxID=2078957 RepID=UPI00286F41DC|nr:mitochondrial import inner membrane translocase subunit Tim29 [Neocloeon triangulifer]